MLVFAGIAPTSPLLLENINPGRFDAVKKTRAALEELGEELFAAHPDTIVIFSEQPTMYPDAFSVNVADPYRANLEAFGDLGYRKTYHPDFSIVDKIQRFMRSGGEAISLSTDPSLHFTTTVPLDFLTRHLPKVRIVPIAPCSLDLKAHFDFGSALREILTSSHHRVAVIAAGDLSHALREDSPAGYHAGAAEFDRKLVTLIEHNNASGLLQLNTEDVENAKVTSLPQILMLLGVLEDISITPSILRYESPFGVGHLVAELMLS